MDFLSDNNELAATDVLVFVREAIQKFDNLQPLIIEKLLETFKDIKSVKVHRAALWILGEYATSVSDIEAVMQQINQTLGDTPLLDTEQKLTSGDAEQNVQTAGNTTTTLVTSDGTYATQSSFNTVHKSSKEKRPPLRQYLMDGDFFIGASLASTLTKLALRFGNITSAAQKNRFDAEIMLIMAGIIHLGKSGLPTKPITNDDKDHILSVSGCSPIDPPPSSTYSQSTAVVTHDMLPKKRKKCPLRSKKSWKRHPNDDAISSSS
ncbi:hypothetical protein JTB14_011376 [Gonioctena quinquepunctata]|nr:hypothetical protein JTB14_011376 [Gonioctena quinquepunctata]